MISTSGDNKLTNSVVPDETEERNSLRLSGSTQPVSSVLVLNLETCRPMLNVPSVLPSIQQFETHHQVVTCVHCGDSNQPAHSHTQSDQNLHRAHLDSKG